MVFRKPNFVLGPWEKYDQELVEKSLTKKSKIIGVIELLHLIVFLIASDYFFILFKYDLCLVGVLITIFLIVFLRKKIPGSPIR